MQRSLPVRALLSFYSLFEDVAKGFFDVMCSGVGNIYVTFNSKWDTYVFRPSQKVMLRAFHVHSVDSSKRTERIRLGVVQGLKLVQFLQEVETIHIFPVAAEGRWAS